LELELHVKNQQQKPKQTQNDGRTCDHFVGKASAISQPTRPTQPAIPPGSVKWVVIH